MRAIPRSWSVVCSICPRVILSLSLSHSFHLIPGLLLTLYPYIRLIYTFLHSLRWSLVVVKLPQSFQRIICVSNINTYNERLLLLLQLKVKVVVVVVFESIYYAHITQVPFHVSLDCMRRNREAMEQCTGFQIGFRFCFEILFFPLFRSFSLSLSISPHFTVSFLLLH